MTTAKMIVLRSDAQKVSLLKSRTKLSTPTNSAARGEISRALVKASPNVRPIGMSRNVISRTAAGSSMSSPVVDEQSPDGLALWPRQPGRSRSQRGHGDVVHPFRGQRAVASRLRQYSVAGGWR